MIVCYTTDPNQSTNGFFETIDDIDTFKQNNPSAKIVHIIPDKQEYTFEKFEKYCNIYGFTPSDYRMELPVNSDIQEFVGFQITNRKYPCITYSRNNKKYLKATPNFIRKCMIQKGNQP